MVFDGYSVAAPNPVELTISTTDVSAIRLGHAVRIPLVLCLDQPHRSARQPLASGSHCLLLPQRSSTASSSNSSARYRKRITPLPAFTASRLSPFTFHFLYIFLTIWCNNTRYTHSLPTPLAL